MEELAADKEIEKAQKSRNKILFAIAIVVIVASLIINIVFDAVEIIPRKDIVKDFSGVEKEYTIYKYAPEYKYTKPVGEFCYTLGIALLVYLCVDLTLHRYDKRKEQTEADKKQKQIDELNAEKERNLDEERKKIKGDVFNAVLEKLIPHELFEILVSDILMRDVIRENVRWEYDIIENKQKTGYNLTQRIMYELWNISHDPKEVSLVLSVDQNACNSTHLLDYHIEKMDGTPIHIDPEFESPNRRVLKLPLKPDQKLRIIHHIVNEYSGFHVTDCHFSNYSIVGLEIRVKKPSNCKFTPIPTFSHKLKTLHEDEENIIYKPVKGLLLGQSLVFLLDKIYKDTGSTVPGNLEEKMHN